MPRASTLPRGEARLEAGASFTAERTVPLSGLRGDLLELRAAIALGVADGVEVRLQDLGWQRMWIGDVDPTAPLAGELELEGDDATSDALDATLAARFRVAGDDALRAALQVDVTLPNAGNESGLGRDETDVALSLLGGMRRGPVRLDGQVGVAILGSPTRRAAQNDQAVLGLVGEVALGPAVAVGAEVRSGFGDEAPGNEILTRVAAGGRLRAGRAWLDAAYQAVVGGIASASGVRAGVTVFF